MGILAAFVWFFAALLSLPLLMFSIECLLGSLRGPTRPISTSGARPKTLVIIPAHNEAAVIGDTLESLLPQAKPGDEILVVADNCTDSTASLCRSSGVRVVERSSRTNRGKGYALAHGLSAGADSGPEVIVILDADCEMGDCALDQLVFTCASEQAAVQARYLMQHPRSAPASMKVSEFAVFIKNQVRMRGLAALGGSVPLSGSGMAFPGSLLESETLASGEIVEDMKLGLDLALQGEKVLFIDHVGVKSDFPASPVAQARQRERWEHGHLGMIVRYGPKMLLKSLSSLRPSVVLLLLDLMIPPLALLMTLAVCVLVLATAVSWFAEEWRLCLYALSLLTIPAFSLAVAWYMQCRHIISARELSSVPLYAARKLGSYFKFIGHRETEWVKTERE